MAEGRGHLFHNDNPVCAYQTVAWVAKRTVCIRSLEFLAALIGPSQTEHCPVRRSPDCGSWV